MIWAGAVHGITWPWPFFIPARPILVVSGVDWMNVSHKGWISSEDDHLTMDLLADACSTGGLKGISCNSIEHDRYGSSDTWSHALEIAQWSMPQSSPEVICHRQDAVQKRAWMLVQGLIVQPKPVDPPEVQMIWSHCLLRSVIKLCKLGRQ